MAEPTRHLYDEELPKDEFAPQPSFSSIEGGRETTAKKRGHLRAVDDGDSLAKKENIAGNVENNENDQVDRTNSDSELSTLKEEGFWKNQSGKDSSKKRGVRGWSRRRKVIAGAVGAGGVGGVIIGLLLGTAPLQIIHLAQILQLNNSNDEETSDIRLKGMYRYWRSGDFGQTRLGYRGSKSVAKSIEALEEIGIKINPGSRFGNFGDVSIQDRNPIIQSAKSYDEAIERLSREFGVPTRNIVPEADGSAYRIIDTGSDSLNRTIIKKGIGKLEGGKISSAMRTRYFGQYMNLPSIWHPLNRFQSRVENTVARRLTTRTQLKEEAERLHSERAPPDTPETREAKAKLGREVNPVLRGFQRVLVLTDAFCIIWRTAEEIIHLNRVRIVLPAVTEAAHLSSLDSQIRTGQDADFKAFNAAAEILTDDDGDSVWQGKALQATEGKDTPAGIDITNENKIAFVGEVTVKNIKERIEFPGIRAACSTGGQIVQAILSLGLLFASRGTSATAANAFTRAYLATIAVRGAFTAIRTVITTVLINQFQSRAADLLAEDEYWEQPASGPLGGNMLAYGAREMANITARSSGGVQLSDEETAAIDRKQIQKQRQEFQSRSFAKRMFDTSDYRSVASQSIQKLSGSPIKNMASLFTQAGIIQNTLASFSTILTPSLSAAGDSNYDWFMPRYGIPQNIMNNPDYQDPYAVADSVATVLNGSDTDRRDNIISRAKACFGVDITPTPEGWDVIPKKDINPASTDYTNNNCAEDEDFWNRVKLFVKDSVEAAAVACYDGTDESACEQMGLDDSSGGPNSVAGEDIVGDPFASSVDIDCARGTTDLGVHDGYVDGNVVPHRLCAVSNMTSSSGESSPGSAYYIEGANGKVIVNSRVSGAVYGMVEAAKQAGVTLAATSSFRTKEHQEQLYDDSKGNGTVAEAGYSNHQNGTAIDFDFAASDSASGSRDGCSDRNTHPSSSWNWLFENAERFGYRQLSFESWHWDPSDSPNYCDSSEP